MNNFFLDLWRNNLYSNKRIRRESPVPQKAKIIGEVVDNLRRIFQAVHVHSSRAKREAGLTGPQLWAIRVIAQSAPLRVSELAGKMYLHPATVVGILDRLESMGLVARTRSRQDRRVVHVELTKAGQELVEKAPEVAQGLLVSGLEALPLQRLNSISEGLADMVRLLGAQALPPELLLSSEVKLTTSVSRRR
jgi:MarR family transcriptional regulator, organic hydroperoxide resistance regulator